jgi:uncharacterized protein (DUF302 family)
MNSDRILSAAAIATLSLSLVLGGCASAQGGGAMAAAPMAKPADGLLTRASTLSVPQAVEKIEAVAKARGLTVFAKIDHAAAAQSAGLQMPPTVLLVMGNPRGGTPGMLAAPSLAIDLPLKVLVASGADGKTTVTFNDAAYLKARHQVPDAAAMPLGAMAGLVDAALAP